MHVYSLYVDIPSLGCVCKWMKRIIGGTIIFVYPFAVSWNLELAYVRLCFIKYQYTLMCGLLKVLSLRKLSRRCQAKIVLSRMRG